MQKLIEYFSEFAHTASNVALTMVIVLSLFLLRRFFLKYLEKKQWASEKLYLRMHTLVRNVFLALITVSIISIWVPQIQAFALSIAAIAVAVVVSIKEIIMMLTGGFCRTTTDAFSIGDRIEVAHYYGDVIRTGFLTTDLLEVGEGGQRTGKIIHIPNSLFFNFPVINEAAFQNFTFHVLTLPVSVERFSQKLMDELLTYTKELTSPYIDKAREEFQRFTRKNNMIRISIEPRVLIKPHCFEAYHLIIRFPVPIHEKIGLEQRIIKRFAELLHKS